MSNNLELCIIAAIDEERGIGKDNRLMWQIPEDMKRFRELTLGQVVIMGRKTFDSLPARFKPLPKRHNIILTRDLTWIYPEVTIAHTLAQAIKLAYSSVQAERIAVVGGGQVYQEALSLVDRLYLTLVEGRFGADTFFPEYEDRFRLAKFVNHVLLGEETAPDIHYRFADFVPSR